jgi:hypothetical protein
MASPDIKIEPYDEFEPGASGFVICVPHWPCGAIAPFWVMPAWDERGYPDLGEVFATEAAAQAALRADGL